jgi:SAM-dependent methyltransferase
MGSEVKEEMRKLDDSQVEAFDTEYVEGRRWGTVKRLIDNDFPDGTFRFLDIGGGNGRFVDRLLEHYPNARGQVLDSSQLLLDRNRPDQRKTLKLDSVENLDRLDEKYDLICLHWLLHHLVSCSYAHTRLNQVNTLLTLSRLLTDRGRISIFENLYEGWLFNRMPGRLIYFLTSAKTIARLTRRMGANTAGVGVCFLSKEEWLSTIARGGLRLVHYAEPDNWEWTLSAIPRIFLHVRKRRVGHFWLTSSCGHERIAYAPDIRPVMK